MKKFIVFTLVILNFYGFCQKPVLSWAKNLGGVIAQRVDAITTDCFGNVLVTGHFVGKVDFDAGPATFYLSSIDSNWNDRDIFIAKYKIDGEFVWAKQINSGGNDPGKGIITDDQGSVYVIAKYQGAADLDPGPSTFTVPWKFQDEIFVVKLDANGNFIWGRGFTDDGMNLQTSIALDQNRNVYFTACFNDKNNFKYDDVGNFLVKLNNLGEVEWWREIGGRWWSYPKLSINSKNEIFVTGNYKTVQYKGDFVDSLISINDSYDVYVAKYDVLGTRHWIKTFGGNGNESVTKICYDSQEGIILTGNFVGHCDFDPSSSYSLRFGNPNSIYVLKLDKNGEFKWVFTNSSLDSTAFYCSSLAANPIGDVFVSGLYHGTIFSDYPNSTLINNSGYLNAFVFKLTSSGTFDWTLNFKCDKLSCLSVAPDKFGNLYTAGYFEGKADADPGTNVKEVVNVGTSDIFIQKLGSCTPTICPKITLDSVSAVCAFANVTLNASGEGQFFWSNGALTPTTVLKANSDEVYTVSLNGWNQCVSSETIAVFTAPCTQIEEIYKDASTAWQLYPNPSTGALYFKVNAGLDFPAKISVFDVNGSQVDEMILTEVSETTLYLSDNNPGVYFFLLQTTTINYRTKFILKDY